MTKNVFAKLRDEIDFYFNEEELKNLCFDLRIEYENLSGTTKIDRCRELVKHCLRHSRMNHLVDVLNRLRPRISWEEFEGVRTNEPSSKQIATFSFLRQWKPDNMPNGFGADILLKSDLNQKEIISFIEFLTTEFITYANTEDAPILIRLWSSKLAYEQDQERDFGDEFRQGFLVFYVKNLTGKGAYNGFNEIRWMQEKGRFSDIFGTVTRI
jgi:hypothetical protein